jgi:hypothetical protein
MGWREKGKVKFGSIVWREERVRYIVLRQAQEGKWVVGPQGAVVLGSVELRVGSRRRAVEGSVA